MSTRTAPGHARAREPRFPFLPRRNRQVAAMDTPAGLTAPDYSLDYDDPGWGENEPHEATSPGLPLPAPLADDTMVWRVPGLDGGPGLVIPPATLATPEPERALPARVPGAAIPAAKVPALRTEPADPGILREVRDGLLALPGDPDPDPAPAAFLRAFVPGGDTGTVQIQEPLGHSPRFAGWDTTPGGRAVAGMYLGSNADGWFVLDSVSVEWVDDAIAALEEMRDCLTAAREQAGTETAA